MFQQFLMFMVNGLFALLTPEKIRGFILEGSNRVVDLIKSTETTADDKLILPAVNLVLAALEIPGENGQIDVDSELKKLFRALGDYTKVFIDAGLDYIEDMVLESKTKIDDMAILPMCQIARDVLNVPDNDEPKEEGK